MTRIDLEFDTTPERGAPLGDIASTLVSVNDLLRDLAAIAAGPSNAAYREIEVVSIEMRSPLTITLSLLGIADEAARLRAHVATLQSAAVPLRRVILKT
jgi:hypothetical protein